LALNPLHVGVTQARLPLLLQSIKSVITGLKQGKIEFALPTSLALASHNMTHLKFSAIAFLGAVLPKETFPALCKKITSE